MKKNVSENLPRESVLESCKLRNWKGKVLIILKLRSPNYCYYFQVRPRSIFRMISELPRSKAASKRHGSTETNIKYHKMTWRFDLDIVPCIEVSAVEFNSTLYLVHRYTLSNVTRHCTSHTGTHCRM
jgi:hypothetical protein